MPDLAVVDVGFSDCLCVDLVGLFSVLRLVCCIFGMDWGFWVVCVDAATFGTCVGRGGLAFLALLRVLDAE